MEIDRRWEKVKNDFVALILVSWKKMIIFFRNRRIRKFSGLGGETIRDG